MPLALNNNRGSVYSGRMKIQVPERKCLTVRYWSGGRTLQLDDFYDYFFTIKTVTKEAIQVTTVLHCQCRQMKKSRPETSDINIV